MTLSAMIGAAMVVAAPFVTDTPMVHDPVMAFEDGTYHLYCTGNGIASMTSKDMTTWTVSRDGLLEGKIPAWTHDSVPGFKSHIWAPDVVRYDGKWYMAYSVSTFGRNTSAIGLLSNDRLSDDRGWKDEGCIIASRGRRDNFNAIDPNFAIDEKGNPWLVFGSFWDGIQMVRLDKSMHVADGARPRTIARRMAINTRNEATDTVTAPSRYPGHYPIYAGYNAIEAPFIFYHDGYYYLFVSWDYCCLGMESSYRVVVGRSRTIDGPYVDDYGIPMLNGGGRPVINGDKHHFEATGHCAVYNFAGSDKYAGSDIFICHGYRLPDGMPVLIRKTIQWVNGWPEISEE